MKIFAFTLAVAGVAALAPACAQTDTLCGKVCDCQHCNDAVRENTCDSYTAANKISKDYGCDPQFSAAIQCKLDHGTCSAATDQFTSQAPGSCSSARALGMACTTAGDCTSFGPGTMCTAGFCSIRACAGLGIPCASDSDCPASGLDVCTSQAQALESCVSAASKDPILIEGFASLLQGLFGAQQQPPHP
jgi:hypothetical protein